jgi:hypothetical protein
LFEKATKTREAAKRSQESVPLTLQADALWLLQNLAGRGESAAIAPDDAWRLRKTFANIRASVKALKL